MVCAGRRLAPNITAYHTVQFTHAAPPYRAEYERIFGVPVEFGCERNALRLNEAMLASLRFPSTPRYVTGVLKDHAEALLAKLDSSHSMRGRVEALLVPALQSGDVGIEAIASALGLSRQTLFRKLKAEGVTFAHVLDELRHKLALHYLSTRNASVKETAHRVGFSDATAFSRAYKRWTGIAPGASRVAASAAMNSRKQRA
jgi:AraC-like DNA-binding protein